MVSTTPLTCQPREADLVARMSVVVSKHPNIARMRLTKTALTVCRFHGMTCGRPKVGHQRWAMAETSCQRRRVSLGMQDVLSTTPKGHPKVIGARSSPEQVGAGCDSENVEALEGLGTNGTQFAGKPNLCLDATCHTARLPTFAPPQSRISWRGHRSVL